MKILFILALLLFKHFLADFILQTKYQYQNKHHYGHLGGIVHALIHTFGTFVVIYAFYVPLIALLAALLDGLVHYHIDWLKANCNLRYNLSPNKFLFWVVLGADQFLHQLSYIAMVAMIVIFSTSHPYIW